MLPRGALRCLVAAACCATAAMAGCGTEDWEDAFESDRCSIDGDAMVVTCISKQDSGSCGMRSWAPGKKFGTGAFSATIRAAPGDGAVTSFYLSNNGGMYDENGGAWNEIDFEILGKQAGSNSSRVWTNLFTGSAEEHHEYVTVPFDTAQDFHTYTFDISTDNIKWLVDGVVYRTQDLTDFQDVQYAVDSSSFEVFMSLWGKTYADSFTACDEFIEGMGKLDDNPNAFPITARFKTEFNPPVPQAKAISVTTSELKEIATSSARDVATTTAAPEDLQVEDLRVEGRSPQKDAQSSTSRLETEACGPIEADITFVVMPPAWYHSVDNVSSIEGCCARCQREGKCQSYTWVKANLEPGSPSQCWMFGDMPAQRAAKTGATSGFPRMPPGAQPSTEAPTPTPAPEPAPTTTRQSISTRVFSTASTPKEKKHSSTPQPETTWGVDIISDCIATEDVRGTAEKSAWHTRAPDVSSKQVCCSWCKAEPRCKSWTWLKVDPVEGASECYLKGAAMEANESLGDSPGVRVADQAQPQALLLGRKYTTYASSQDPQPVAHSSAVVAAVFATCALCAAALLAAFALHRQAEDLRPELAPLRATMQDAAPFLA